MGIDALPCMVCGCQLSNVVPDKFENQPIDGTAFTTIAFTTTGHFGSTFFDPMDGQQLEINVCDACLQKNISRIAWRRAYRAIECQGTVVGFEYLDEPLVPYRGQADFEDPRQVTVKELGTALGDRIMWNANACDEVRRRNQGGST